MKLFGGKQSDVRRSRPPDEKPAQSAAAAAAENTPRRGGARRAPTTLLALCLALAALAAGAALAIRPQKAAAADGEAAQSAIRPAVEPERVIATPPPTEPPEEEPPATEEPVLRSGDAVTFALLGWERAGGNTDTVITGRFDPASGRLDLVSIPRDTLVNVEWAVKKINTVLNFEDDPEGFLDCLSRLTGFRADRYAVVDAAVAEALIHAIGGVYYNVFRDFDYDDPVQDLHIHIPAGLQWLDGTDTVKLLRFRVGNDGTGYPDGDLGRIRTQQDLLGCLARQLIEAGGFCIGRLPWK